MHKKSTSNKIYIEKTYTKIMIHNLSSTCSASSFYAIVIVIMN